MTTKSSLPRLAANGSGHSEISGNDKKTIDGSSTIGRTLSRQGSTLESTLLKQKILGPIQRNASSELHRSPSSVNDGLREKLLKSKVDGSDGHATMTRNESTDSVGMTKHAPRSEVFTKSPSTDMFIKERIAAMKTKQQNSSSDSMTMSRNNSSDGILGLSSKIGGMSLTDGHSSTSAHKSTAGSDFRGKLLRKLSMDAHAHSQQQQQHQTHTSSSIPMSVPSSSSSSTSKSQQPPSLMLSNIGGPLVDRRLSATPTSPTSTSPLMTTTPITPSPTSSQQPSPSAATAAAETLVGKPSVLTSKSVSSLQATSSNTSQHQPQLLQRQSHEQNASQSDQPHTLESFKNNANVARTSFTHVQHRTFSVDDFSFLKKLGQGAFSQVFLVQSKSSKEMFALKVLQKEKLMQSTGGIKALAEKDLLKKIKNPFIISYFGSFQDDINQYVVIEYVYGRDLFRYLRHCGHFEEDVARFFAAEVLLALEYLHSLNIIYRDMKPENILVEPSGHLKLIDFGLAREVTTTTATFCGTAEYIAPEMLMDQEYNHMLDYYAYGVLVYEMLIGQTPFYDPNRKRLYDKILEGRVNWPSALSPMAKDLVKSLLHQNSKKRLGAANGSQDVKNHKWFHSLDWTKMEARQTNSPFNPEKALAMEKGSALVQTGQSSDKDKKTPENVSP